MKNIKYLLILFVFCIGSNFSEASIGMTVEEVKALYGEPSSEPSLTDNPDVKLIQFQTEKYRIDAHIWKNKVHEIYYLHKSFTESAGLTESEINDFLAKNAAGATWNKVPIAGGARYDRSDQKATAMYGSKRLRIYTAEYEAVFYSSKTGGKG